MIGCVFGGWSVCGMDCLLCDPAYLDGRPRDGRCVMYLLDEPQGSPQEEDDS